MEKFSESPIGKYTIEHIKTEYKDSLNMLTLSNYSNEYFEYASERAGDILELATNSNPNLNEVEVREIAYKEIDQMISDTIEDYPNTK